MIADPWNHLKARTTARIALGRAGGSLPTTEVMNFAMAHAVARDAVHAELDAAELAREILPLGVGVVCIESLARDRGTYLQRPDLGRRVCEEDRALLASEKRQVDLVIIIADGLSSLAAQRQAPGVLKLLMPRLKERGVALGPVVIVRQGRVAIEDEIGERLGAKAAIILLGERPGLGTADSLGAYLVFEPRAGKRDADRNCVSNIRAEGLPVEAAARTIEHLVMESLRRKISGVGLKDERVME